MPVEPFPVQRPYFTLRYRSAGRDDRTLCHTERVRAHLATLVADFRRHGSQIAVVTHRGNRRLPATWEELAELSARFAAELSRRGHSVGDRALIWGDNSVEWVAAFFGCVLRGVVAVPIDVASAPEFARRVAGEVQPKLVVGNPELIGQLDCGAAALGFAQFPSVLPAPDYTPASGLSRETVLQIVFTSGTTAEPKGIVHTHGNVLASLDPLEAEIGKYLRYERIFHPLRFLHTLPLSHVFGQFMGLWVPPLIAAEVHYESRLEASRLIRTLHDQRISILAAVPRVLDLLRAHLIGEAPELPQELAAAAGLPLWRRWWRFRRLHRRFGFKFWALVSGGAALPPDLENFWTTAGFALIQGYGMTETTALVTLNHPFKPTRGSIGKPLAGREVEIGPEGEILVRGASIADRIWRRGKMEPRGEDWLATGDLVTRDVQGDLVFAGRKSDVIVTSAGLNIHPQDLEAALRRQPGIRESVVVPYISPAGPVPAAILILNGITAETPETPRQQMNAAVDAANRGLATFQQILYSLQWPQPDFPRTSTGKVLRREVGKWAQQRFDGRHVPGQAVPDGTALGTLADPLIDLIHQLQPVSRNQTITGEDRLAEDLRLDSLAMVELQSGLETKFGVELDDTVWQRMRTVGDLRSLLNPAQISPGQAGAAAGAVPELGEATGRTPGGTSTQSARPDGVSSSRRAATQVFPRWPWWPVFRIVRIGFLELVMRPLVWLLLAPKIGRRVDLPRPALLIANHVTAFDPAILLYALRVKDRDRVAIAMSADILAGWRMGKAQTHRLWNIFTPLAYWLVTALFNVFPLPRSGGLRQSFAHAGEALDRGYHVLVFPEGRRSADGELQAFESGIGLLARDSQVPVQPIYIAGLGPLEMHQKFWFRPGAVSVRLGAPLTMAAGEEPSQFAQRLRAAVEQLKGAAS